MHQNQLYKSNHLGYLSIISNYTSIMSLDIPVSDVIRLILQFLQENNLTLSFQTLQQESQICINTAHGNDQIIQNSILAGKWDSVLLLVKDILLPQETLFTLYETIAEDMISHAETDGATYIINQFIKTRPSAKQYQERILRLDYLCMPNSNKPNFKQTQPQKRKSLSKLIADEIIDAPSQRLLKLLSQSLKFQAQQGIINPSVKLNLFSDKVFEYKQEEETLVRAVQKIIRYPEQSKVSAMEFSHKGDHLALGFDDGLIELYNPNQYKIDSKLQYQNSNNFLFHTTTVTCLAFQQSDEMLASGDKSGQLKLWNLLNGKCLRKINTGSLPVSAVSFGPDPSNILSAYQTIDVYGLKSSTILRSFKGHSSYVNSIIVLEQKNEMLTCSKDGSIKVWNYITQEQMKSYSPNTQNVVQSQICKLIVFDNAQRMLICTRSNQLVLTQPDLRSFDNLLTDNKEEQYVGWAVSGHKGMFIYSCVRTSDKKYKIVSHNKLTKRIEFHSMLDGEIKLMAHHPTRNILVTFKSQGNLEFWRP